MNQINFFLFQKIAQKIGRQSSFDIRTVVGGNQNFVAGQTQLGLEHQIFFCFDADDADDFIADFFMRAADRQDLGCPHPGGDTDDNSDFFYERRNT